MVMQTSVAHIKRSLTSPIIKEMQIKAMYYFFLLRLAKMNVESGSELVRAWRTIYSNTQCKYTLVNILKLGNIWTTNSISWNFCYGISAHMENDQCQGYALKHFFLITKYWEQHKFPLFRDQLNQSWCIQKSSVKIMRQLAMEW